MSALGLTTFSLSPFSVTWTFALGTTPTIENAAPFGFQHCVHPHTWLCSTCVVIFTSTGRSLQRQRSVPPAKSLPAGLRPPSTAG